MKNKQTELVFILDESGSMFHLKNDTIGGFNSMISNQKKIDGDCFVTTVLFSNHYHIVHDRENLKDVKYMSDNDYQPNGTTALMDTIGYTIEHIKMIHKYVEKPNKTLFVIMTDGYENDSHRFNRKQIKEMITTQKEKFGWEFMFIGANIDSEDVADSYGIDAKMAANYHADEAGSAVVYESINEVVSNLRKKGNIESNWNHKINKDYKSRSK